MIRCVPTFFAFLLIVALVGASAAAQAQEVSPESFFGHYKGSGVAQGSNVFFYDLGDRDLDVEIGPDGEGFFVAWTTVIREPGDDEVKRNSARISFAPSGRPGIYMEAAADKRIEHGLSWAAIVGDTLSVRELAILDDGSYAIQTYHRSLSENGMFLHFVSDRDGQSIRTVTATLTKEEG